MMMNERDQARDNVLVAFHDECEFPTHEDVERWAADYPCFAEEIREHAAIRIAVFAEASESSADVDELMHARGRSRLQDAIYHARRDDDATGVPGTFATFACAASITPAELARKLPMKRGIVADLFEGRMVNPRPRFRDAVSRHLRISPAQFSAAYDIAIKQPSLGGRAKSHGQPTVNQRDFADIIRSSGMDPEQIRYWLDED